MKVLSGFIVKELKGDTLTPISILKKITGTKKFLLESSHKYNDSGRYSFIGADPALELISTGAKNQLIKRDGSQTVLNGNPLEILKNLLPKKNIEELPFPFIGGAVGYVGYDIIRQYEDIGDVLEDRLGMPDVHLMFYEELIVFDHLQEKVIICGLPLLETTTETMIETRVQQRIQELKEP